MRREKVIFFWTKSCLFIWKTSLDDTVENQFELHPFDLQTSVYRGSNSIDVFAFIWITRVRKIMVLAAHSCDCVHYFWKSEGTWLRFSKAAASREAQGRICQVSRVWGAASLSLLTPAAALESLRFRAYPKISAWKSSFCPRETPWWSELSAATCDCVTAGNFWFCCTW